MNLHLRVARTCLRTVSSSARTRPSSLYLDPTRSDEPSFNTSPLDLTHAQQEALDSALRVDQAGEIAANWIYKGQMAVLDDPKICSLIQDMWDQEKRHLAVMDKLQVQHNVRPTILSDVAKVAGFGLGAATALLGKEAAMACTEAVEIVIGEHYDDQLKELDSFSSQHPSLPVLKDLIRELRDDELEHLDVAVENDSQRAPAHALLSSVIVAGCKVAIELCRRV
ncbi:COQ7 protein [Phlegmacium glaucopus]|nr:COQ7 protein [Phlegmacium glaucopus]